MSLNEEYIKVGSDIIRAAYNVRNTAGRGLREIFYEAALEIELTEMGHSVRRQVDVPAVYKGVVIEDSYRADMVVDGRVIIEVKALGQMKEAECRQLLTYLKLSLFKLGYLINFGAKEFRFGRISESLPYVNGIYRLVNNI